MPGWPGGGKEPALWLLVPESICAGWRSALARQHVTQCQGVTWEAVGEPAGGGEPLEAAPGRCGQGAGGHCRAGPSKQKSPGDHADRAGGDPGVHVGSRGPCHPAKRSPRPECRPRGPEPRPGTFHRRALPLTQWAWLFWLGAGPCSSWPPQSTLPTSLHCPPLPLMSPGPFHPLCTWPPELSPPATAWAGPATPHHPGLSCPPFQLCPALYVWKHPAQGQGPDGSGSRDIG